MKYYVVWLNNTTDREDDEPVKVRANSKKEAEEIVMEYGNNEYRFYVGGVYTMPEFKKEDPWWHSVLWKWRAINESPKPKRKTKSNKQRRQS